MKFLRLPVLFALSAFLINSCVKQSYDAPPDSSKVDPNLPVNATLRQIAKIGSDLGNGGYRKMGDTTVAGIVVADDRSGNYYKQIVIEDESLGGIVLYMDKSYLYNDFPVGRRVYVKLKDLYVYNYNGLPQIIYSYDIPSSKTIAIPAGLVDNYLVKGAYPVTFAPKDVALRDIIAAPAGYINTLVRVSNVQFATGAAGVSYADPSTVASATNRTIESCDRTLNAIIRTSGYSNFQPYKTPNGNGTVTAICTVFGSTLQLVIRDTTDVKMTATRCL